MALLTYAQALVQWAKDFPRPTGGAKVVNIPYPPAPIIAPIAKVAPVLAPRLTLKPDPRGIRDNNPGNIRIAGGSVFKGAIKGVDTSFATFSAMAYGVRAAYLIFLHYERVEKLLTIEGKINRWAPPVENNTSAYVTAIAKACGVAPSATYSLTSVANALTFLAAVFVHENGGAFVSSEDLNAGVKLALS